METYVINGVEVEFDTYDLVNLELIRTETEALSRRAKEQAESGGFDGLTFMKEMCEGIMDFFDLVVGEGTAERCFGSRPNVKVLTDAYAKFVEDVSAETSSFRPTTPSGGVPDAPEEPRNREERRAAERARKRQETEERMRQRRKDPSRQQD